MRVLVDPEFNCHHFDDWGCFERIVNNLCWVSPYHESSFSLCRGLDFLLFKLTLQFTRVAFFGDDLNIINVSGIVVVFFGVFLYKVTLHLSKAEKEVDAGETDSVFSRVSSLDAYDDEMPRRHKHKNSNPDLALSYTIDDEDDDDEEEEDVMDRGNLASPLRRTNGSREAFEMGDVEVPPVV